MKYLSAVILVAACSAPAATTASTSMTAITTAPGAGEPAAVDEQPVLIASIDDELPIAAAEPAASACAAAVDGLGDDRRLYGSSVIIVDKTRRHVGLYRAGKLAGCWRVALGMGGPVGPKRVQGDLKTPEGWYRTSDKPTSDYYGAIAIHYPNLDDADRGLAEGRIDEATHERIGRALAADRKPPQETRLGGEILIHGGGNRQDWTLGCVALDNADLDQLRAALPPGLRTDILILP